jgi:hypothetical protein
MQIICQWLVVIQIVGSFFAMVHMDFHGRQSKEPAGFHGFIGSCVGTVILAATIWGAGGFDCLFGY